MIDNLFMELELQAKMVDRLLWSHQDECDVRPLALDGEGGTLYVWACQGMRGYMVTDTANGEIDYYEKWGDLLAQIIEE